MNEYREMISFFVPMDEEEQKDFCFVLLDTMDEIDRMVANEKDENKKKLLLREKEFHISLANFFLKPPNETEAGPSVRKGMRQYAKQIRATWGRGGKA